MTACCCLNLVGKLSRSCPGAHHRTTIHILPVAHDEANNQHQQQQHQQHQQQQQQAAAAAAAKYD